MSKYGVGFELQLDQLLELTKPRKRRRQAWTGREVGGPTSGLYRRVTPRILLPTGKLPRHLIEPTPEESAAYERRRAEILRRGGKARR